MSNTSRSFPHDLGSATRVGLVHGIGLPAMRLDNFAQAEMLYREQRMLADVELRRNIRQARLDRLFTRRPENGNDGVEKKPVGILRRLMSRWTTWPQSALAQPSSPEPQSSNVCSS
jgi:hypothetical protein